MSSTLLNHSSVPSLLLQLSTVPQTTTFPSAFFHYVHHIQLQFLLPTRQVPRLHHAWRFTPHFAVYRSTMCRHVGLNRRSLPSAPSDSRATASNRITWGYLQVLTIRQQSSSSTLWHLLGNNGSALRNFINYTSTLAHLEQARSETHNDTISDISRSPSLTLPNLLWLTMTTQEWSVSLQPGRQPWCHGRVRTYAAVVEKVTPHELTYIRASCLGKSWIASSRWKNSRVYNAIKTMKQWSATATQCRCHLVVAELGSRPSTNSFFRYETIGVVATFYVRHDLWAHLHCNTATSKHRHSFVEAALNSLFWPRGKKGLFSLAQFLNSNLIAAHYTLGYVENGNWLHGAAKQQFVKQKPARCPYDIS